MPTTIVDLAAVGFGATLRSRPGAGGAWKNPPEARDAVYGNRRRVRGKRGRRLLRRRGELVERPFAHLFETAGMRRVHLRGRSNILKHLLVHVARFNLRVLLRQAIGAGTPRGLRGGVVSAVCGAARAVWGPVERSGAALDAIPAQFVAGRCTIELSAPSESYLNTGDFYLGLLGPDDRHDGRGPRIARREGPRCSRRDDRRRGNCQVLNQRGVCQAAS